MQTLRNKLIALAAVGILAVVGTLMDSHNAVAQNQDNPTPVRIVAPLPVPVTGTTTVSGTVSLTPGTGVNITNPATNPIPAVLSLPANSFTIPPTQVTVAVQGSGNQTPDPPGTRYAITSVVFSNGSTSSGEVDLSAVGFSASASTCEPTEIPVQQKAGPKLQVGPNATGEITFPQPFVTDAVSGSFVCLMAGSPGAFFGMTWSAVGYKIP